MGAEPRAGLYKNERLGVGQIFHPAAPLWHVAFKYYIKQLAVHKTAKYYIRNTGRYKFRELYITRGPRVNLLYGPH